MDQKLKNETLYLLKENTSIFLYNPSIGKTINFASISRSDRENIDSFDYIIIKHAWQTNKIKM